MKRPDRMFGVIVLGGISLTAAGPEVAGCGGSVATPADAGGSGDAFPYETGAPLYDSGTPADSGSWYDGFPSETAQFIDTGIAVDTGAIVDSGTAQDSFPQEGPAMIDSGTQIDP